MDQNFGAVTSLVNALRNRRLYRHSSVRLLADLVEVTRGPNRSRRRGATSPVPAGVLDSDLPVIRRAAASSPCLFHSLQVRWHPELRHQNVRRDVHRVLLCQETGLGAPLDVLAQLLAASIAAQFGEPAAAASFVGTAAHAHLYVGERELDGITAGSYHALERALITAIVSTAKPRGSPPLLHLIVAAPDSARALGRRFTPPGISLPASPFDASMTRGYDRILHVSHAPPATMPREWEALLTDAVRHRHPEAAARRPNARPDPGGPFFSSFVASILGTDPAPGPFDTTAVDEEFQVPDRRRHAANWRLERDQCRIPFNLAALRNGQVARRKNGTLSKGSAKRLLADPTVRAIAERWARAATNRRVGVALSGGGASSYRLVPILRGIHQHVPVDIVGGVSGGALVAAYYCHSGLEGLTRCLALGERISPATLLHTAIDGGVFQRLVDADLGRVDVTQTERTLVALTTALIPHSPPEAHVVRRGTLGEAVQVSGAAPGLFAPIDKVTASHGTLRFTDGAMAAFIPVRILRGCGADLVFALNCLPGPENHHPLDKIRFGRLIAGLPLLGRVVDLWMSASYLAQRIGRETDEDAHVYFEPDPESMPLVQSFFFSTARTIARESAGTKKVRDCIRDCKDAWTEFRTWG